MSLWDTVKARFSKEPDMAEENTENQELTDEELDRLTIARAVERGLTLPGAAPPVVNQGPAHETIPGTDIAKPVHYDALDYEQQMAYVSKETRMMAVEEARAEAKRDIETANSAVLKELQDLKGQLSNTLTPYMKQQAEVKVSEHCSDEARPFIAAAIKESEERFKRSAANLSDNDAWMIANRAEVLLSESRRASAPAVVYSETAGVPETGADKKVLSKLNELRAAAPNVSWTYADAQQALKEDSLGV